MRSACLGLKTKFRAIHFRHTLNLNEDEKDRGRCGHVGKFLDRQKPLTSPTTNSAAGYLPPFQGPLGNEAELNPLTLANL